MEIAPAAWMIFKKPASFSLIKQLRAQQQQQVLQQVVNLVNKLVIFQQ